MEQLRLAASHRPLRALVLALLLLLLVPAAPSSAHTDLLSSRPNSGGTLAEPPEVVSLEFVSALALSDEGIVVRGPDGDALEVDVLVSSTRTVFTVELRETAPAGVWTVEYDGISEVDGHPVTGSFAFAVGAGATAPPADAPAGNVAGGVTVLVAALTLGFVVLLRGLVEQAAGARR